MAELKLKPANPGMTCKGDDLFLFRDCSFLTKCCACCATRIAKWNSVIGGGVRLPQFLPFHILFFVSVVFMLSLKEDGLIGHWSFGKQLSRTSLSTKL